MTNRLPPSPSGALDEYEDEDAARRRTQCVAAWRAASTKLSTKTMPRRCQDTGSPHP